MARQQLDAVRASIEDQIEGKTLGDLFARNAEIFADQPALSWKERETWRRLTWAQYRNRVAEATMGLQALGVGHGDFVAIMCRNRPEHMIADLAAVHAGATAVSIYNTLAPEQIQYIAEHCGAKVAVVEGREFMERWEKVKADLPSLERVVLVDDAQDFSGYDWVASWEDTMDRGRAALRDGRDDFEATWRKATPEDPVTLIYTSGTTGPPKAVVITHRNVLWTTASLDRVHRFEVGLSGVSYLPLAHIAERVVSHYLHIYKAGHVHTCPDILRFIEVVEDVHPDVFFGVPRVWEKLQAGIIAALEEEPNARKRSIAEKAIEAGKRTVRLEQAGSPVPLGLRIRRGFFDRLVYSKIRAKIGFDRLKLAATAAAPISEDVLVFFHGIGIPVLEVYGMTEDSGPATANPPGNGRIGTVGPALPGVELRVLEDGELLVRGGNVVPGYYKDEAKTAETFDPEGWLHTGDLAQIGPDGYVKIVDRKKELIITAGGKNIAPSNLETLLKQHPLVGQACVVGDRRPYISALVVLDSEVAPVWAKKNGVPYDGLPGLAEDPRLLGEIQRAVDEANQHVSRAERIKRFTILPTEWTVDSEELTPTLKLKRRVIHRKYADEIEEMYAR